MHRSFNVAKKYILYLSSDMRVFLNEIACRLLFASGGGYSQDIWARVWGSGNLPRRVIFKFLQYCCRPEIKLAVLFQKRPSPFNSSVCIDIERGINFEMLISSRFPASEI